MPAIVVPGKENAGSFLRVPLLARGADQKTDARASRTAFPRWSVGTIKNALLRIWPFYGAIKFVVLVKSHENDISCFITGCFCEV